MESTIGKRIKRLREGKNLSVADFAKCAGVKPSAIYGLESDANKPSIETVAMLRQSFPDLNTEWLQFGDGPMYKGAELAPASGQPEATPPAGGSTAGTPLRYTSGEATVEEASTLIKLAEAEAENRQLLQRLEDARGEILWLRGKSTPSSYAAAPEVEPLKMRRWHEVVSELPPVGGKQLFMDNSGPVSDKLAA